MIFFLYIQHIYIFYFSLTSIMDLAFEDKNIQFYRNMEIGDLSLLSNIPEAVAIFGDVKVGKTSACHILANNPMKAHKEFGALYWKPIEGSMYEQCKVGYGKTESETLVPNIFQKVPITVGNRSIEVTLIDMPGYGDIDGFHKMLATGYFHWRVFSKTPRLKFIIAFSQAAIEDGGTTMHLQKLIKTFLLSFKNYKQISQDILNATCFLITKVPINYNKSDIIQKLKRLRGQNPGRYEDQKNLFDMLDNMIANQKIFLIHKPAAEGNIMYKNCMLTEIYQKTKFWERQTKNGTVSMNEVRFYIRRVIHDEWTRLYSNELFREDIKSLMEYTETRIGNLIQRTEKNSLLTLINTLKADAEGPSSSRSFIEVMAAVVNEQYSLLSVETPFVEKRMALIKQMFDLTQTQKISEISFESKEGPNKTKFHTNRAQSFLQIPKKTNNIKYSLKKLAVLEDVMQKINKIYVRVAMLKHKRTIQLLDQISSSFKQIFKFFNSLRKTQEQSAQIICKHGYLIHRCLEEGRIWFLLLFHENDYEFSLIKKLTKYNISCIDIILSIIDCFIMRVQIDIQRIKADFIKNINTDK